MIALEQGTILTESTSKQCLVPQFFHKIYDSYALTLLQFSFWNNRSMSLVDMYIETGDPSEKCGELNFSLDYDFATQTLKLKMIQVTRGRELQKYTQILGSKVHTYARHQALWGHT